MTGAEFVEEAIRLIHKVPDLSDFCGPASAADITKAEQMLGFRFPSDYRLFLSSLGAGNFGSQEFFGIIPGNVPGSSVPSVVWLTLDERKAAAAPDTLMPVWNDGGGYQVCVRICPGSVQDGTVVLVDRAYRIVAEKAASFGAFFLTAVDDEGRILGLW